ncbi:MAG: 3D domain-containing protein [Pygmaiobacter massiliensis]|nr:3D domain-containing protein [Pygmaiobacter massiliensis]
MKEEKKTALAAVLAAAAVMAISLAAAAGFEDEAWRQTARADAAQSKVKELAAKVDELSAKLSAVCALPEGLTASYAGEFTLTAYCTEPVAHICNSGSGITKSGAPVTPGVTVAADLSVLPLGSVVYIEGVGVRLVQDTGSALQGKRLDVAVDGIHADALSWPLGGQLARVWILGGGADAQGA